MPPLPKYLQSNLPGVIAMYSFLKFVHLVAVVLFLGNIVTGVFWHVHAARTRDPKLLAHTVDGIIRSDRWFTIPGVVGLVGAGVGLAILGQLPLLRTGWILWSVIALGISGVIFAMRVSYYQGIPLNLTFVQTSTI